MRIKRSNYLKILVFIISLIPLFAQISNIKPSNAFEEFSYLPQNPLVPNSCTIFTVNISDTVFFGNNEDYYLEGTYMWLAPSQVIATPTGYLTTYGAVGFGFKYNDNPADGYIQGGMNDQGLCLDGNGLPEVPMNYHPERDPPYTDVLKQILVECSNVSEVIDWFLSHNLGHVWSCQLHFADALGDAVVVSVGIEGEFNFTRKLSSHYLVSTNFNLVNYANGYYPCSRYTTASVMLAGITSELNLTVDVCRDVLDAVHQEGVYATKYSNVFDPINLKIHLFYNHNFNQKVSLDLREELSKVHPGGEDVIQEIGYYYKELSIVSLFTENPPIVPVYALVILILSIAALSLIFALSGRKRSRLIRENLSGTKSNQ